MKKMTVIILCIAVAVCVCGCLSRREGVTREFLSEQNAAENMLEEIIKCTEEGDTESFMDLFSDYSRNSQPELEEQIREMMDFYEGKMESYQGNASSHEKSEYGSTVYSELKAHYTVITDKDNYEIAFQYRMIDAEDPVQEGLVSFEIATEEAYQQDDFKWMCEDNPGVYVQR